MLRAASVWAQTDAISLLDSIVKVNIEGGNLPQSTN